MSFPSPFLFSSTPGPDLPHLDREVADLSGRIECTEFVVAGGYGQIYKGRQINPAGADDQGLKIAVKIISVPPLKDDLQKNKRFRRIQRELELWSAINHENILPLFGIARINGDTNIPAFICPWMENGNAKEFLIRNPTFPPIRILYDIIKGLHYLHTFEPEIVHGDIKAANVLINDRHEACLCDFGLSRFVVDNTLWRTTATHANGTLRWMAPELLEGDEFVPTKASDMYAYGLTCYEIISGNIPFESIQNDAAVLLKVIKGHRPERTAFRHADHLWDIITRCWAPREEDRPSSGEVLELMQPAFANLADVLSTGINRTITVSSSWKSLSHFARSAVEVNDYGMFSAALREAKNIVVLAGAGLSAASGIRSYRGSDSLWNTFDIMEVATTYAFNASPSKVWKFCNYLREVALVATPNPAHRAIALLCSSKQDLLRVAPSASSFRLVTRNTDNLSNRALPTNAPLSAHPIEMRGNLFRVECVDCDLTEWDLESSAWTDHSGPEAGIKAGLETKLGNIPKCRRCGGLVRPGVSWFNPQIEARGLNTQRVILQQCDLVLVVGLTSGYIPTGIRRFLGPNKAGPVIAIFNLELPDAGTVADFVFVGPCEETLVKALGLKGRLD